MDLKVIKSTGTTDMNIIYGPKELEGHVDVFSNNGSAVFELKRNPNDKDGVVHINQTHFAKLRIKNGSPVFVNSIKLKEVKEVLVKVYINKPKKNITYLSSNDLKEFIPISQDMHYMKTIKGEQILCSISSMGDLKDGLLTKKTKFTFKEFGKNVRIDASKEEMSQGNKTYPIMKHKGVKAGADNLVYGPKELVGQVKITNKENFGIYQIVENPTLTEGNFLVLNYAQMNELHANSSSKVTVEKVSVPMVKKITVRVTTRNANTAITFASSIDKLKVYIPLAINHEYIRRIDKVDFICRVESFNDKVGDVWQGTPWEGTEFVFKTNDSSIVLDKDKFTYKHRQFRDNMSFNSMILDAMKKNLAGQPMYPPMQQENRGKKQPIMTEDWDFSDSGIGGMDDEFKALFRRAFASRLFPEEFVKRTGVKHTKGIMLHGPPGTGKTLIARKIGQMLNCGSVQVVNGPEIFAKYVGDSEGNIRKLFVNAERDASLGTDSPLHLIIFDEIDAIAGKRGRFDGGSGVSDKVVNQLLTKIDGINQLDNLLVIGMTNRLDMIDPAITRPGRFDVIIKIGLPDTKGRVQIINIHSKTLRENNMLADDVDVNMIAQFTPNFSGAELEGLVKSALSHATENIINMENFKADKKLMGDAEVTMDDFMKAIADIKPAMGSSSFRYDINGYFDGINSLDNVLVEGEVAKNMLSSDTINTVSLMIKGASKSGRSTLAQRIADQSEFPFVRFVKSLDLIGMSDKERIMHMVSVIKEAEVSKQSVVIFDDIEQLIDGSQTVLNALLAFQKTTSKNKLLLIYVFEHLDLTGRFTLEANTKWVTKEEASDISDGKVNKPMGIKQVYEEMTI